MSTKISKLSQNFYLFSFFDNFILIYPLYAIFFADSGLNATQISRLFVIWSLVTFLLELPSGALADRYSRRNILLFAQIAKLIGFLLWLLFRSYLGFLFGFIFWSVKVALTSGAKEAYVYDELSAIRSKGKYAYVSGRMDTAMIAGVVVGGIGASALIRFGYTPILITSMMSVFISFLVLFRLPETKKYQMTAGSVSYLSHLKNGVLSVISNSKTLGIVLGISFIVGFGAMDEYFGLFFRGKGFASSTIAIWVTLASLFAMIGSMYAHRFKHLRIKFGWLMWLWSVLIYLSTTTPRFASPIFICAYMLIFSAVLVLLNSSLQHQLDSKSRATASSISGLLTEMISIAAFFYIGVVAGKSGYVVSYLHYSWVLFAAGGLYLLLSRLNIIST